MEGVLGVEDGIAVCVGGFARLEELKAGLSVVGGGRSDVVVGFCEFHLEMRGGGGRRRRRRRRGTFEDGAEELAAGG